MLHVRGTHQRYDSPHIFSGKGVFLPYEGRNRYPLACALNEAALRAAIAATGYTAGEIRAAPYEKKGLFSFLKK